MDHPVSSQATHSPMSHPKSAFENSCLQLSLPRGSLSATEALTYSHLSPVPLCIHPSCFSPTGKPASPPQAKALRRGSKTTAKVELFTAEKEAPELGEAVSLGLGGVSRLLADRVERGGPRPSTSWS